jgi:hypothetical protein
MGWLTSLVRPGRCFLVWVGRDGSVGVEWDSGNRGDQSLELVGWEWLNRVGQVVWDMEGHSDTGDDCQSEDVERRGLTIRFCDSCAGLGHGANFLVAGRERRSGQNREPTEEGS